MALLLYLVIFSLAIFDKPIDCEAKTFEEALDLFQSHVHQKPQCESFNPLFELVTPKDHIKTMHFDNYLATEIAFIKKHMDRIDIRKFSESDQIPFETAKSELKTEIDLLEKNTSEINRAGNEIETKLSKKKAIEYDDQLLEWVRKKEIDPNLEKNVEAEVPKWQQSHVQLSKTFLALLSITKIVNTIESSTLKEISDQHEQFMKTCPEPMWQKAQEKLSNTSPNLISRKDIPNDIPNALCVHASYFNAFKTSLHMFVKKQETILTVIALVMQGIVTLFDDMRNKWAKCLIGIKNVWFYQSTLRYFGFEAIPLSSIKTGAKKSPAPIKIRDFGNVYLSFDFEGSNQPTFIEIARKLQNKVIGETMRELLEHIFELEVPNLCNKKYRKKLNVEQLKATFTPKTGLPMDENLDDINILLTEIGQIIDKLWDNMDIVVQNGAPVSFKTKELTNAFNAKYSKWLELTVWGNAEVLKKKLMVLEAQRRTFQNTFNQEIERFNNAIEKYEKALTSPEAEFPSDQANSRKNYKLVHIVTAKLDTVTKQITTVKEVLASFMEWRAVAIMNLIA